LGSWTTLLFVTAQADIRRHFTEFNIEAILLQCMVKWHGRFLSKYFDFPFPISVPPINNDDFRPWVVPYSWPGSTLWKPRSLVGTSLLTRHLTGRRVKKLNLISLRVIQISTDRVSSLEIRNYRSNISIPTLK